MKPQVPAILRITLAALTLAIPALAQDSDGDTLRDADEINIHLTDPKSPDTDGDGLRDDWEIYGIPYTDAAGVQRRYRINNPGWSGPAVYARRKTLYVETDAMSAMDLFDVTYSLAGYFRNAPVANPDGSTGIELVVWTDEKGLPRVPWTFDPASGVWWPPEFAAFKSSHFGSPAERANPSWSIPGGMREAKLKAYHYIVFAERLGSTNVSGMAELFGNDVIVTLGGWYFGGWPPTPAELLWRQRVSLGVTMHELGHNLGLHHGGYADVTNFKPNYHSVQNYSWTTPRNPFFPPNPNAAQAAYGASWVLDYSRSAMPNLDENMLSEPFTSMCGGCTGLHASHVVPIGPASGMGWGSLVNVATAGIDFNSDGDSLDSPVAADINAPYQGACSPLQCDGPIGCTRIDACPLLGKDDWSNVVLMGGGGQYANGVHGAVIPSGQELSFEDSRMLALVGGCEFDDSFDFYNGEPVDLQGRGGWKGWDDDPSFSAPLASVHTRSGAAAVEISGPADLVHELCARHSTSSSLAMAFSVWQYIPADFTSAGSGQFAGSYLVIMNSYQDGGEHVEGDWSVQMQFDSNDGMLKVFHGAGLSTVPVPYDTGRWVRIQAIIDLDQDWTRVYYDDALITEYPWTGGVLGGGGGALDIGAVDLYANGSSPVYYDDLRFEHACGGLLGDEDLDGLPTEQEFQLGTSSCKEDSDEDGLRDGDELMLYLTSPVEFDSDGDGLGDGEEISTFATDPHLQDSDFNGIPDGEEDLDFDGIANAEESHVYGTDPRSPDTDGDALLDITELQVATDPIDPDTDDDSVPDGADNCPLTPNAAQADHDHDGIGDACDEVDNCPGDLDGDAEITLTDLSILLTNFGTEGGAYPADGDSDGNGAVDLIDLSQLLSEFGTSCL